jgi:hypothetical protein
VSQRVKKRIVTTIKEYEEGELVSEETSTEEEFEYTGFTFDYPYTWSVKPGTYGSSV